MNRIVMLMPHFGSWPPWIEIFLETCRRNPTLDWLFFTECGRPGNVPPNVRLLPMSYGEFLRLAGGRLGVELPAHSIRKLCDLRPMLGAILEEHTRGYDFYGFGDVDVVYGDLRAFFTEGLLREHDVLSCHSGMISGHFSLFRCADPVRNLFRRIPGWEARLCDPRHLRLDEDAFSRVLGGVRSSLVERFTTPSLYRRWRDGTWWFPTRWYWHDGAVTNDRGPGGFPYFHFLFWKGDTNPWGWRHRPASCPVVRGSWQEAPLGWRIDEDGFHPLSSWPEADSPRARRRRAFRARIRLELARMLLWREKLRAAFSGSGPRATRSSW